MLQGYEIDILRTRFQKQLVSLDAEELLALAFHNRQYFSALLLLSFLYPALCYAKIRF